LSISRIVLSGTCFFWLASGCALGAEQNATCKNAPGDSTRIQAVIDGSSTGDAIHIHGMCQVSSTIVLLGDRSYLGDSRTGTVLAATSSKLAAVMASDSWANDTPWTGGPVRVAHLTIQGTGKSGSMAGVLIRSWQSVLEDLQVLDMPGDGIRITNLSRNGVALSTTQVNGHIDDVFVSNSGGDGIRVQDSGNSITDWSLLDSWVANSAGGAIALDNAAGWTLRGNHVYGVGSHAIRADRCYATTIDGNYVEDFGSTSAGGAVYGIRCTVQGGDASVISGNKVFNGAHPVGATGPFVYIGVSAVNYGVGEITVTGNVIRGVNSGADTGLSFSAEGGQGLLLESASNNVQAVTTPRLLGRSVSLVHSY